MRFPSIFTQKLYKRTSTTGRTIARLSSLFTPRWYRSPSASTASVAVRVMPGLRTHYTSPIFSSSGEKHRSSKDSLSHTRRSESSP